MFIAYNIYIYRINIFFSALTLEQRVSTAFRAESGLRVVCVMQKMFTSPCCSRLPGYLATRLPVYLLPFLVALNLQLNSNSPLGHHLDGRQAFFGTLDLFAVPFVVCPLVGWSVGQRRRLRKCTACCFMWARAPDSWQLAAWLLAAGSACCL